MASHYKNKCYRVHPTAINPHPPSPIISTHQNSKTTECKMQTSSSTIKPLRPSIIPTYNPTACLPRSDQTKSHNNMTTSYRRLLSLVFLFLSFLDASFSFVHWKPANLRSTWARSVGTPTTSRIRLSRPLKLSTKPHKTTSTTEVMYQKVIRPNKALPDLLFLGYLVEYLESHSDGSQADYDESEGVGGNIHLFFSVC